MDEFSALISVDTSSLFDGLNDNPIPYLELRKILRKSYDKSRGLNTGLHGIEVDPLDDPTKYSLYAYWCRIYRDERIGEHYRLSIDEFLDRPRYKINILLEEVKEINDRDSKLSEESKLHFERMLAETRATLGEKNNK